MPPWLAYAASGVSLFAVGMSALVLHGEVMRKILAANVSASGVFLVLVALARRAPKGPPDPVPHALVLTGIVVSVSATALALALVRQLRHGAQLGPSDERRR